MTHALIQSATAHHQAGRLAEAEALYRQILQNEPKNAGVLHLLGLIARQVGQSESAAELIAHAIRIAPSALMYCDLGLAFAAQGKHDLAIESFRQAIALKPDYAEACFNLGTVLQAQGRLEQALEAFRQALALRPNYIEAHFNAAIACHRLGWLEAAEQGYRQTLALKPNLVVAHNNLGVALQKQGKFEQALDCFHRVLSLQPGHAEAHFNLADTLQEQGKLDESIDCYRQAIALNPDYANAHYNLAIVLQAQGRLDESVAHYERAVALRPNHAEAHNNLGNAFKAREQLDEAAAHYRLALAINPDYADAHFNLGIVLLKQEKMDQAAEHILRSIELKPDRPEAHNNLAAAYKALGHFDEAIAQCRRSIAIEPNDAEAFCNLAVLLKNRSETDEAIASCQRAIALKPDCTRAYSTFGSIYVDLGKFDLAQAEVDKALACDPDDLLAWALLANLRKMKPEDEAWLQKALRLLNQDGRAQELDDLIALQFAIGKYYDDTKQYDPAFAAYAQANTLKRRRRTALDRDEHARSVDTMIAAFRAEFFLQAREGASRSERPVLIVGMPRSGTSLTEQIIASHPAAFGAGELTFWSSCASAHQAAALSGKFEPGFLGQAAQGYEQLLQRFSATASRVVDKMPGNFWHLGMIAAAFPHAKIIHTRRNPVDTCLSIHFQNFNASHNYGTDLDELAFYYRGYVRLMDHWRSVLPADRYLEVPYEALIADQEVWSRRIIAFLGLEWDDACLDFHKTERKVGTASNWQVRQKIYQTSKERWRNYEQHVGPLLGLLDSDA